MKLHSFFWKKRKIGAEAATDPSSRGRGKVELNSLCSFFSWWSSVMFFRKKRKIGAESATGPSSSEGRVKVELNSLCFFFFWMEEDGA
jgi:hypothetical protein